MDTRRFDGLARELTTGTTRRHACKVFGAGAFGVALTRLGFSAAAAKKKRKKKKADVNKLCKKQPGAWTSYILTNGDGTPAQRQALNACGTKLGTCDFSGFWSCYITAVAT